MSSSQAAPTQLAVAAGDVVQLHDVPLTRTPPSKQFSPSKGSSVNVLRWSHNNQVIVSGCEDGTLALNHVSGALLGTLGNKEEEIYSLSFSSGSRYLCSGGSAREVKIWDLKKKGLIKTFSGHTDGISCLQFAANDSHVASGSLNGYIRIHSILTGQTTAELMQPSQTDQAVRSIQYSPFKKSLLGSALDSGVVALWDTNTKSIQHSFKEHSSPVSEIAFSELNHLLLASAGLDRQLLFYDITDRKIVKKLECDAPLTSLAFLDDGFTVAVGTTQGTVTAFDLRTGSSPLAQFPTGKSGPVNALRFQTTRKKSKTGQKSVGKSAVGMIPPSPSRTKATAQLGKSATSEVFKLASQTPKVPQGKLTSTRTAGIVPPPRPAGLDHVLTPPGASSAATGGGAGDLFSPLKDVKPLAESTPVSKPGARGASGFGAANTPAAAAARGAGGDNYGDLFSPLGATTQSRTGAPGTSGRTGGAGVGIGGDSLRLSDAYMYGGSAGSTGLTPPAKDAPAVPSPVAAVTLPDPVVDVQSKSHSPLRRSQEKQIPSPLRSPVHSAPAHERDPEAAALEARLREEQEQIRREQQAQFLAQQREAEQEAAEAQRRAEHEEEERRLQRERDELARERQQFEQQQLEQQHRQQSASSPARSSRTVVAPTVTSSPARSTAHHDAALVGGSGGVAQFQTDILRSVLEDTLSSFRESMHAEIQNLHLEVLRQFELQKRELSDLLVAHGLKPVDDA